MKTGRKVIVATPHCNIPGEYNNYFGKEYCRVFPENEGDYTERAAGHYASGGEWKSLRQKIFRGF